MTSRPPPSPRIARLSADDGSEDCETQVAGMESFGPAQTTPRVRWVTGDGERSLVLSDSTVVGSAPGATIVVRDPMVSRLHAEFEPRPDGSWWVRDLDSRNGTFVEGIQVTSARIPPNGHVRLGSTEFVFEPEPDSTPVPLWPESRFGDLVGTSRPMRRLFHFLSQIAATDASVLIGGETGTGKELVARSIHDNSARKDKPFVVVDCGALPENLMESELFGHVRGAFTGAAATTTGAIEAADGGTVFLDEIGELPLSMQPKLLRLLEKREVRRVGEAIPRPVNVRIVSASHRDLRKMVNSGSFREDLYFRLAVLPVHIPPLRERLDDIPPLLKHFLKSYPDVKLSPSIVSELCQRPWLGNVRELRNFVERLAAVGSAGAMAISFPPPSDAGAEDTRTSSIPPPTVSSGAEISPEEYARPFKEFRERWVNTGEKEYVRHLLERHEQNVSLAAQAAGLDRTYLYRLIRKHFR